MTYLHEYSLVAISIKKIIIGVKVIEINYLFVAKINRTILEFTHNVEYFLDIIFINLKRPD